MLTGQSVNLSRRTIHFHPKAPRHPRVEFLPPQQHCCAARRQAFRLPRSSASPSHSILDLQPNHPAPRRRPDALDTNRLASVSRLQCRRIRHRARRLPHGHVHFARRVGERFSVIPTRCAFGRAAAVWTPHVRRPRAESCDVCAGGVGDGVLWGRGVVCKVWEEDSAQE